MNSWPKLERRSVPDPKRGACGRLAAAGGAARQRGFVAEASPPGEAEPLERPSTLGGGLAAAGGAARQRGFVAEASPPGEAEPLERPSTLGGGLAAAGGVDGIRTHV